MYVICSCYWYCTVQDLGSKFHTRLSFLLWRSNLFPVAAKHTSQKTSIGLTGSCIFHWRCRVYWHWIGIRKEKKKTLCARFIIHPTDGSCFLSLRASTIKITPLPNCFWQPVQPWTLKMLLYVAEDTQCRPEVYKQKSRGSAVCMFWPVLLWSSILTAIGHVGVTQTSQ